MDWQEKKQSLLDRYADEGDRVLAAILDEAYAYGQEHPLTYPEADDEWLTRISNLHERIGELRQDISVLRGIATGKTLRQAIDMAAARTGLLSGDAKPEPKPDDPIKLICVKCGKPAGLGTHDWVGGQGHVFHPWCRTCMPSLYLYTTGQD